LAQINRHRLQGLSKHPLGLREGLSIQTRWFDRVVRMDTAPFKLVTPLPIFPTPVGAVTADRKPREPTLFLCLARIPALLQPLECHLGTLLSSNIVLDDSGAHVSGCTTEIAVPPPGRQF
jgi:hypothetical protein